MNGAGAPEDAGGGGATVPGGGGGGGSTPHRDKLTATALPSTTSTPQVHHMTCTHEQTQDFNQLIPGVVAT